MILACDNFVRSKNGIYKWICKAVSTVLHWNCFHKTWNKISCCREIQAISEDHRLHFLFWEWRLSEHWLLQKIYLVSRCQTVPPQRQFSEFVTLFVLEELWRPFITATNLIVGGTLHYFAHTYSKPTDVRSRVPKRCYSR